MDPQTFNAGIRRIDAPRCIQQMVSRLFSTQPLSKDPFLFTLSFHSVFSL